MAQWKRVGFETAKSNMIVIDPYQRQFHFQCWIFTKNLCF